MHCRKLSADVIVYSMGKQFVEVIYNNKTEKLDITGLSSETARREIKKVLLYNIYGIRITQSDRPREIPADTFEIVLDTSHIHDFALLRYTDED